MGERKGKAFRKAERCRRIEVSLSPLSVAISCPWGVLTVLVHAVGSLFFIPPTSPTRGIAFLSLPPNVLAGSLRSKSKVFNSWGLRALAKIYIGNCKCCNCVSVLPPIAHMPIYEREKKKKKKPILSSNDVIEFGFIRKTTPNTATRRLRMEIRQMTWHERSHRTF